MAEYRGAQTRINQGRRQERRTMVYRMRARHMTFPEIAEELDISLSTAYADFNLAVQEIPVPERAHVRALANEWYEYLGYKLRVRLDTEDLTPTETALISSALKGVVDSIVNLWGAKMPRQVEVNVHSVDQLDVELAGIVEEAKRQAAIESATIRGDEPPVFAASDAASHAATFDPDDDSSKQD